MEPEKLQLSDLCHGVEYPMPYEEDADRCRIHVKMTEISMKSVEALIHSEKGAFFSLWFEESGGKISIPVGGRDRVFQLKMAPGGGQTQRGSLECVHQELDDQDQHQLKCLGPLEHRLTVQGTDESYERTKKKMEQVEIERNKNKAQEIRIIGPKGQSKSKKILQPANPSPAIRRQTRPVQPRAPPPSGSLTLKNQSNRSSSSSAGGTTSSPRPSHSLKDRVMHLLALKPLKRSDLVARLKKETKRSETNMSKLDDILAEVSELVQGAYKLKASLFSSIQVKDWKFYSEPERQLLKRKLATEQTAATETAPAKRPLPTSAATPFTDSTEPVPKKPKLVYPDRPDRSALIPTPPLASSVQTGQTGFPNERQTSLTTSSSQSNLHTQATPLPSAAAVNNLDMKMNGSMSAKKEKEEMSEMVPSQLPNEDKSYNSTKKSKVKKKKKKPKHKETAASETMVASNPTSTTTNIPDHSSQFPPITTDEQRCHYKQVFAIDYEEYSALRENIETVSPECTTLSKKLDSLPRHCDEAKEVRQQIRNKYRQVQQYKSRFDELHHKLDHIKKMVVAYDKSVYPT